jgi:hypothetical protein
VRWRRAAARVGIAAVLLLALAFTWIVWDDGRVTVRVALEGLTRSEPDRAVALYVDALTARDAPLALGRWTVPPNAPDALLARRAAVTDQLLGTTTYRVTRTEWWGTCCEPHIIRDDQARYAGFARLWVDLDGRPYVFDVHTWPQYQYFDDDGRPRTWVIWDVYPASEGPLLFRWPGR